MSGALLEVSNLSVTFSSGPGAVAAVRSVSYDVRPGEVLGIVGESGSGKSVSSLAVMNLLPGYATVRGSARFRGEELIGQSDKALSHIRGRRISMIFQDPLSALTPVYTVGDQIAETILVHEARSGSGGGRAAAMARAIELLDLVGIPNARQRARAFPHEFSGGMRQRAMIAMAIANNPDLIIADEPTTALDVTIQAQILDVLRTAREATGAAVEHVVAGVALGFVKQPEVEAGLRDPRHNEEPAVPEVDAAAVHEIPALPGAEEVAAGVAASDAQVFLVKFPNATQMLEHRLANRLRQHRHTIFLTFPVADNDDPLGEINILKPQPQRFRKPQS